MFTIQFEISVCLSRGGGGGGSDEVWDRETMFSQLAKRSIRGLVSGIPRRRCVLSISKELRILSPPANGV